MGFFFLLRGSFRNNELYCKENRPYDELFLVVFCSND